MKFSYLARLVAIALMVCGIGKPVAADIIFNFGNNVSEFDGGWNRWRL